MTNVTQANLTQPSDWVPTAEQIEQMWAAMNREAYPPAQRNGVGTVLRRAA
jgi:hypothetical protein